MLSMIAMAFAVASYAQGPITPSTANTVGVPGKGAVTGPSFNAASSIQSGNFNLSEIKQDASSAVGNEAATKQTGNMSDVGIRQINSNNTAYVTQSGGNKGRTSPENQFYVRQEQSMGQPGNMLTGVQNGSNNEASTNQVGSGNNMYVNQQGSDNNIGRVGSSQIDGDRTDRENVVNNEFGARQLGRDNRAALTQNGSDHNIMFLQDGNDNYGKVDQDGKNHDASLKQVGNENWAFINQDGMGQEAVVNQMQNNDRANVQQGGNSNNALIIQNN